MELRLPQILLTAGEAHARKRLIVDYGEPLEYRYDATERRVQCAPFEAGLGALGEADVKFTRYADRFRKLMVDSIDGDSVPIALLHFERRLRTQSDPPQVSVYRMELSPGPGTAGTKRKAAEGQTPDTGAGTQRVTDTKQRAKRKPYEFVNIPALYESLRQVAMFNRRRALDGRERGTRAIEEGHTLSLRCSPSPTGADACLACPTLSRFPAARS